MKAKKVYEFVNPRERNFDLNLGRKAEIKKDFDAWLKECNYTDEWPRYEITKDLNVIVLDSFLIARPAKEIPEYVIEVNGDLDIEGTYIEYIKHHIHVTGEFIGRDCPLKEFPNVTAEEGFDITGTEITKLPDPLNINGNLLIYRSPIAALPDNIYVNGNFVAGESEKLVYCGKNIEVTKKFNLSESFNLSKLPENLKCEELDISFTKIEEIPDSIEVSKKIYISRYMSRDIWYSEKFADKIELV